MIFYILILVFLISINYYLRKKHNKILEKKVVDTTMYEYIMFK